MKLHEIFDYTTYRLKYISFEEGEPTDKTGHVYAYASDGIAHIGIGLNLRTHLNLVLKSLGFDVDRKLLGQDKTTSLADSKEQGYIGQIRNLIAGPFVSGSSLTNDTRTKLNEILKIRADDTAYAGVNNLNRIRDFSFFIS